MSGIRQIAGDVDAFESRWGALQPAEEKLLTCFFDGIWAVIDSTRPTEATEDNTIRAHFLVFLCKRSHGSTVEAKSLELSGAWIEGEVDLEYAELGLSLVIRNSTFVHKAKLGNVQLKLIDFAGSWFQDGLDLSSVQADNILLTDGFFS